MKCLYGKYEYAIAKVAKQKQSVHNKYYSRCKCVELLNRRCTHNSKI